MKKMKMMAFSAIAVMTVASACSNEDVITHAETVKHHIETKSSTDHGETITNHQFFAFTNPENASLDLTIDEAEGKHSFDAKRGTIQQLVIFGGTLPTDMPTEGVATYTDIANHKTATANYSTINPSMFYYYDSGSSSPLPQTVSAELKRSLAAVDIVINGDEEATITSVKAKGVPTATYMLPSSSARDAIATTDVTLSTPTETAGKYNDVIYLYETTAGVSFEILTSTGRTYKATIPTIARNMRYTIEITNDIPIVKYEVTITTRAWDNGGSVTGTEEIVASVSNQKIGYLGGHLQIDTRYNAA